MIIYKKNINKYLEHDIFKIISEAADTLKVDTYVVGGYVRDTVSYTHLTLPTIE